MTTFGAVLRAWFLGALLGRDGVERGPGLFHFLTATAGTDPFTPCWALLHNLKCGSSRKKISDLQPSLQFHGEKEPNERGDSARWWGLERYTPLSAMGLS